MSAQPAYRASEQVLLDVITRPDLNETQLISPQCRLSARPATGWLENLLPLRAPNERARLIFLPLQLLVRQMCVNLCAPLNIYCLAQLSDFSSSAETRDRTRSRRRSDVIQLGSVVS